jgi:hypothetical protein
MEENALALLPRPRQLERGEGRFRVPRGGWVVSSDSASVRPIHAALERLGVQWSPGRDLPPHAAYIGEPAGAPDAPPAAQGYAMRVSPTGVALAGADDDGLFWALRTLEQMLKQTRTVPACTVIDWPELAIRGHHDDVSRRQVSTVDDFLRILRGLGAWKINLYTLYLEDMLHLPSMPDVGEGRGKLTADEVVAIVDAGADLNIDVMPTFSLAGHQENLLALPRYRHLAREVFQPPSTLDPAKPAVREHLQRVLDDVCPMFPCRWFHMGFDEMIGVTREEFLDHANWCAAQLVARGKTPLMWVDMVYNHFGYEAIHRLHEAIVPVNWHYGDIAPGDEVPHQSALAAQGRPVWGLCGNRGGGLHLPDNQAAREHFAAWMRTLARHPSPALINSYWCDGGREMDRHVAWQNHAAFAEYAWGGADAETGEFDARFQTVFYGRRLEGVGRVLRELPQGLNHADRRFWLHHRRAPEALIRHARAADAKTGDRLDEDVRTLTGLVAALRGDKRLSRRNADHLDHLRLTLTRQISVLHRMQLARRVVDGADQAEVRSLARKAVTELRRVLQLHRRVWMRHYKPHHFEDAVRDVKRVCGQLASLARRSKPRPAEREGYRTLPLPFDTYFPDIAGVPIGETMVDDVPFAFAGPDATHLALRGQGAELTVAIEPARLRDVHLIASQQTPSVASGHRWPSEEEVTRPALRVEWLRGERTVFGEDLLSVRHLCDWWAPRGQHIWAGGGLRYVDPSRVRYALGPEEMYDLTRLFGFGGAGHPRVDAIRLTKLIDEELRLFAMTVEVVEE